MLVTAIAYHPEKKLAVAYNQIMERMYPDDWVCFLDHDAMFTTYGWYNQIQEIIEGHPNGGLFAAMTNRIGVRIQVPDAERSKQVLEEYGGPVFTIPTNPHDIPFHRKFGSDLAKKRYAAVTDITNRMSNGVVMVTSKKMWEKVGGFNEEREGLGGCDTDYHRDVKKKGGKVYLMQGVYVYHWYREIL